MNNTKKLLLLLFAVAMVINLQFNTPLTHNMDKGFSIEQLAENIFVPELFASNGPIWKKVTCEYTDGKLTKMTCSGSGSQWCQCDGTQ